MTPLKPGTKVRPRVPVVPRTDNIIDGGPRGPAPKPAGYGAKPAIPTPVSGPPSNMANPTQKIANYMAKGMKKGGSVGSASKRADGIATKGKTKGKIC